jgi:hypothetical protein
LRGAAHYTQTIITIRASKVPSRRSLSAGAA